MIVALEWVSTGLVVIGVAVITLAVIGLVRMPDTYMALHSATKAASIGLVCIALASIATGDLWIVGRAVLIAIFLLLTTPVSSHAVGKAAYVRREPMVPPDLIDESGRLTEDQPG